MKKLNAKTPPLKKLTQKKKKYRFSKSLINLNIKNKLN